MYYRPIENCCVLVNVVFDTMLSVIQVYIVIDLVVCDWLYVIELCKNELYVMELYAMRIYHIM